MKKFYKISRLAELSMKKVYNLGAQSVLGTEQLEKSREIIKRLKEEKKRVVEEMEEKLVKAEDDMETEKEKLVQEVSRGKSAAITLLQVQVQYSPFIPLLHRLFLKS